ncbi:hypothetical protein BJX76DRAFT_339505 [Aspergillus varians]
MRTRSQPASPGGLVSLEDMQRATRRVTRATRSASRGVSQEPSSQQSSSQQPTEPETQPTTRSKSKKTTTKKSTAATSNTKPQTRKGSKRETRSTIQKTNQAASDEAQPSIEENHLDTARDDDEDSTEVGTQEHKSGPSTSDASQLEPKNAELNRKRSRTKTSPDSAEPVTPYANKRRNLGPPGSTPFMRRHTNLTRRFTTSLAERKRRRTAESQGRIHSTIFRLPQLVAQTEADRRASETTALTPPSEPLQPNLNLSSEQAELDDQAASEETTATAQEPSTPESVSRSWKISGLLNSVPRSFSRFLPRFGRSRATSEIPATQQPASERIQRTQRTQPSEASSAAAPETQSRTRRHSSEQPPAKRPRNLSYSLFPAPIDRSLYLGDAPTKSTTSATAPAPAPALAPAAAPTPALQPPQQDVPQRTETHTSIAPTERGRDSTPKANKTASESQKKKRKRSSSPDVIPNPAGASYGMDLDYFCYSSDSEDDEAEPSAPQTQPRKVDTLGKTALRNAAQTERPASKKVRFDASPEDTPSKRRARATDPYQGRHFVGMGGPQASSAPTTPTPESRVYDPRQRPGFIPNRTGTFELDYDAFSDDSDSSGAASPPSTPAPSDVATVPTSTPHDTQSNQSPAPPSTARPAQTPSTPAKIDDEALARARSQAEKYKPKTPSGLRTASRYSSPLTAASPNLTPNLTPAPSADKITKNVTEKFGDDQFAKDAQWLYENCPSGDLRQLAWPARQPFGEGLNISANSLRILNEIWDPADVDNAYDVFQREYADFKKTLA